MRRRATLIAALALAGGLICAQQLAAQRVTVTVSLGASEVHDAWYRLYEEQHPNVKIESFVVPGASMEDFLRARAAAGTLPDLFAINSNAFGHKFMADGFAADLAAPAPRPRPTRCRACANHSPRRTGRCTAFRWAPPPPGCTTTAT